MDIGKIIEIGEREVPVYVPPAKDAPIPVIPKKEPERERVEEPETV